jgi:hypothetical protein
MLLNIYGKISLTCINSSRKEEKGNLFQLSLAVAIT